MANNNLAETIKESLENIGYIADSNTVIGDPIETTGGTVIIPVSKLSMGFCTGGLDYHAKSTKKDKDTTQKVPSKDASPLYGGGGGTGISVTPVCFLVVDKEGRVSILNIDNPAVNNPTVGVIDSISSLADKTPDLITKIKSAFGTKKKNVNVDDEETEKKVSDING